MTQPTKYELMEMACRHLHENPSVSWTDVGLHNIGVQLQIENLKWLRQIIADAPERRVDLDSYRMTDPNDANDCSTLFCTYGWATTDPNFIDMRIELDSDGFPPYFSLEMDGLECNICYADQVFGPGSGDKLFRSYGFGRYDDKLVEKRRLSDKELALARIDRVISEMERADYVSPT